MYNIALNEYQIIILFLLFIIYSLVLAFFFYTKGVNKRRWF